MADVIFKLYSNKDFTDKRYLEIRSQDLNPLEFSEKISEFDFFNEFSINVLKVILNSCNGAFKPDRVDVYDPISDKYDDEKNIEIVNWISQAGGDLYLKKTSKIKYQAHLSNERISKVWSSGKSNLVFNDPEILSSITFRFSSNIYENYNEEINKLISEVNSLIVPEISFYYKGEELSFNVIDDIEAKISSFNYQFLGFLSKC